MANPNIRETLWINYHVARMKEESLWPNEYITLQVGISMEQVHPRSMGLTRYVRPVNMTSQEFFDPLSFQ